MKNESEQKMDNRQSFILTMVLLGGLVLGVIFVVTPNPTGFEAGGGPAKPDQPVVQTSEVIPEGTHPLTQVDTPSGSTTLQ